MSFDEIMNKIKAGLTGETEKDVIYIMQKTAEYKKSPFSDEISRETGKMIYNMLPEKEKALFAQVLSDDDNEIKNKINDILKNISEGGYADAIKILEEIIPNIQNDSRANADFDYVSLGSLFEMYIYTELFKKGRLVKPTRFNFAYIYKLYGYCLFKLSRDDEAKTAYENALLWNPVGADLMLDLSEIMYINKNYKNFLKLIKSCLKYSYDISQISLCYFNLGRYYFEKENYEMSVNMYILSNYFKPNKAALNKLKAIAVEKNIKISPPTVEEMRKICEDADVFMGVNPDIIKIALDAGTNAKHHGLIDAAKYFYDILFSLTADKAVLDTIFSHTKELEKNI